MWSTTAASPDIELLVRSLPEVREAGASPTVRAVFEDSQCVMRVPVVDVLLRMLANYPPFLENAWLVAKGSLQSRYAEAQADQIRQRAVLRFRPPGYSDRDMLRAAGVTNEELVQIHAWNVTQQYLLPKMMLFAAAWQAALSGVAVGGARRPLQEREVLPGGIAEGTASIPLVEPGRAPGRVEDTFARIRQVWATPIVHDYFRGLANWPEYLDRAWADIRSATLVDEYVERRHELWWLARAAAEGMPYDLPSGVEWAVGCGLEYAQIQEIQELLGLFAHRVLPDALLAVSLARVALDGHAAAARMPFSLGQPE